MTYICNDFAQHRLLFGSLVKWRLMMIKHVGSAKPHMTNLGNVALATHLED